MNFLFFIKFEWQGFDSVYKLRIQQYKLAIDAQISETNSMIFFKIFAHTV